MKYVLLLTLVACSKNPEPFVVSETYVKWACDFARAQPGFARGEISSVSINDGAHVVCNAHKLEYEAATSCAWSGSTCNKVDCSCPNHN